ncbi:MAG: toprim domain-containing protein, partial [Gammaproteobacteria bacterium]
EINKDSTAIVQDRTGNDLIINLKKSPTNAYCKDQAIWHSYPNPATRKASNMPKLTSVNEFLVSVTRGDQVTLLVDHIESYQHALEQRVLDVRSSLEFLDPDKNKVRAKVEQMTCNITGFAEKEPTSTLPPKVVAEKNSLYEKSQTVTVEQVINKLHSNILQHATNWLGQPQKTSNLEARWGKKGSLVVKLSGDKAGYWHNFEKGLGGKNLLSLYTEHFNRDFKTAIQELSSSLHIESINKLFTKPINTNTNQKSQQVTTLDLKKIAYVNKIYNSGTSISGTLAEKYLREFRGINGCIPSDFRFCAKLNHPDLNCFLPALLAPIKNEQDQIQGIVRIFLNKDGNKLNSTYVDDQGGSRKATVKANLGSMINAAVTVNQGKVRNTVYIAEGIETALSIAQAKPNNTIIAALSVSNLKNVSLPNDTQKVVLCADYDGNNPASNKALMSAAKYYLDKGLDLMIAYPEKIPGMNKVDFNDVLKHLGTYSIVKSLHNSIPQTLAEINKSIESNNSKVQQTTSPKMQESSKNTELNNLNIRIDRSKELSL